MGAKIVHSSMSIPDTDALSRLRLTFADQSTFDVSTNVTRVGSSASNEIALQGGDVAPLHAIIYIGEQRTVVCDQGTASGTHVNGRRVVQSELSDGDKLSFGSAEAAVSLPNSPGLLVVEGGAHRAAIFKSLACSAAIALLVLLLLLILREARDSPDEPRVAENADGDPTQEQVSEGAGAEGGGPAEDLPTTDSASESSEGTESREAGEPGSDLATTDGAPAGEAPPADGGGAEGGDSSGSGADEAAHGNIFDFGAGGSGVVFLIDRSSSMKGKRFQLAKEHLIAAIGDLDPGVGFSVIFYNNIHEVAPYEGLRRRSDTVVSEISEWIDSQSARGGTNILTPVVRALVMDPDTIFLLSDGEFEERVPSAIDRMNVKRVRIHTISLHVASDSLEKIAADSGGEYRFVSP